MPYGNYAKCPQCGVVAYGDEEIERVFGYRYDRTMPQSWCKECRGSASSSDKRRSIFDSISAWTSDDTNEEN